MRSTSHLDCILRTSMTQDEKLFFRQPGARIAELQMRRIQPLPRAKQRFVMETIDVVLAQHDR